ncbi:ribosomal protein S18-alanine N-acetyltransferase [Neisseria lisongii]|uniref:[Ribosomal protein bS18]-alanine N-acetyltransferase n=1 Tax=Neisseria lisongii TaxID=2912188 RepID=A0AAW5AT05_9NEIS|nr:ribosomal protein S18-alanine N-acetyltransferase [Neisseria lisongii]MCF7530125.1 ribosomal protein S18-alanine N-acetyltransferase [Neisseria lisongii]
MIIRPAAAADCQTLAQIDARGNPSPWSAAQFQAAVESRFDSVAVCECSGKIGGFIVWQSVCGESELHLIATSPEHRRCGIASALLAHWFQTASAQHIERLFLEVRQSNAAAQNLYRKHGFQTAGIRKNYYPLANGGREDAVLMEKSC